MLLFYQRFYHWTFTLVSSICSLKPFNKALISREALIGSFEMNNISIEFREDKRHQAAFEGTGLYPLVCSANHSCEPNAWVDFDTLDSKAWMFASNS